MLSMLYTPKPVNTSTNTPSPVPSNEDRQASQSFGRSLRILALPFAASIFLLVAAMLLRAMGAPIWVLRATIVVQGIVLVWFLVAILIWGVRMLRPAPDAAGGTSRDVPQFLWRLGGSRTSPAARKWAIVMFGGSMLAASPHSISGTPPWLRATVLLLGFTITLWAYWRLEKILDDNADELVLQIRQRALRFTFTGQFVVWTGVYYLNQAGLLPDFRWSFLHLSVLTVALYLVGTLVVSRRYL
jgi:hypothetical protein